jgi:ribosome-associated protein
MQIAITTEYIKLDQLLKFSGACESGAVAKEHIKAGEVNFNGEPCLMRGKRCAPGTP